MRALPLIALLILCSGSAFAQDTIAISKCYAPQVGEWTIEGCNAIIAQGGVSARSRAVAFRNRGLGYHLVRGEIDRAIEDFDESLRIQPDNLEAFLNRGAAYYDKSDYDRALEDFGEAIRVGPRDTRGVYDRGNTYLAKGRFDLAIRDFDATIALDPYHALAYANRCWARAADGPLETALDDCNAALKIEPRSTYALNGRGVTHLKLGDLPAALADFNRSLAIEQRNAFGLYGRGVTLRRMGMSRRATPMSTPPRPCTDVRPRNFAGTGSRTSRCCV
jgi:tetratricopeptide (TPR) repeat protein